MPKVMTEMNLQLANVISDLSGVIGSSRTLRCGPAIGPVRWRADTWSRWW